ncbi:hypothetical protein [Allgaiera indica]|nr:hypothetical protein [Allgaiera indica]
MANLSSSRKKVNISTAIMGPPVVMLIIDWFALMVPVVTLYGAEIVVSWLGAIYGCIIAGGLLSGPLTSMKDFEDYEPNDIAWLATGIAVGVFVPFAVVPLMQLTSNFHSLLAYFLVAVFAATAPSDCITIVRSIAKRLAKHS